MANLKLTVLLTLCLTTATVVSFAYTDTLSDIRKQMMYPQLVSKMYESAPGSFFWSAVPGIQSGKRQSLIHLLDSCSSLGLNKEKYHYRFLVAFADASHLSDIDVAITDQVFTDAAIALCKDIYQGVDIADWIGYDEISPKSREQDNEKIISGLTQSANADELTKFVSSLEPRSAEYKILKNELHLKMAADSGFRVKQLVSSLNLYRWVHHFSIDSFIVVNICAATLRYYKNENIELQMRTVVGKRSTKTPRFAAHCNEVILYPYWNVPNSITQKELLPMFKRAPWLIDGYGIQVLNSKGQVIDPKAVNWKAYAKGNFPYRLRQGTGCDNALGVIKFNLTSPYGVYMHDTNVKSAFPREMRYLSHGCIRVEKPVELANALLPEKLDTDFLAACIKNETPHVLKISSPVPVFVVYMCAEVQPDGTVKYYRDVYKFLK